MRASAMRFGLPPEAIQRIAAATDWRPAGGWHDALVVDVETQRELWAHLRRDYINVNTQPLLHRLLDKLAIVAEYHPEWR